MGDGHECDRQGEQERQGPWRGPGSNDFTRMAFCDMEWETTSVDW